MFRNGEHGILVQYDIKNGITCPLPKEEECEDYLQCPNGFGEECAMDWEQEAISLFDSFDITVSNNIRVTIKNKPGSRKYETKVARLESIEPLGENAEIKMIDLKNRAVTIGYRNRDIPVGVIGYSHPVF